ncbi:MAG: ATP-binding protein [Lachnospiraceae bacterium]|nr:ATP-binding protein [Lachnospiraceae bacterium]
MRNKEFLLYKNFKRPEILNDMSILIEETEKTSVKDNKDKLLYLFYDIASNLIELAASHGYKGNLWHMYLTYLLANNENPYSLATEQKGDINGTLNDIALHDFEIFRSLFEIDLDIIEKKLNTGCMDQIVHFEGPDENGKLFNKRVRDRICRLGTSLSKTHSVEDFKAVITDFYKEFGVGKFGLHKAFRVERNKKDEVVIKPITKITHVYLDDLVGYEIAKQKLIDNTEAFVYGRPANNCLLFGDAGTGKSSSIKGILNKYYENGLRIIEIYKHQFKDINAVIAQIKNRNYKFILYMDDLSFEDFEIEYKYLKAVIEGGLEKKPDNVLIYATSNRRHLIKETWSDREDVRNDNGIHKSDTMQEKLSLVYRFGVTIYFEKPDKKEFQNIVKVLARKKGLNIPDEELLMSANRFELNHGGLSGRTAVQFIDYLLGKDEKRGDH